MANVQEPSLNVLWSPAEQVSHTVHKSWCRLSCKQERMRKKLLHLGQEI